MQGICCCTPCCYGGPSKAAALADRLAAATFLGLCRAGALGWVFEFFTIRTHTHTPRHATELRMRHRHGTTESKARNKTTLIIALITHSRPLHHITPRGAGSRPSRPRGAARSRRGTLGWRAAARCRAPGQSRARRRAVGCFMWNGGHYCCWSIWSRLAAFRRPPPLQAPHRHPRPIRTLAAAPSQLPSPSPPLPPRRAFGW